MQCVQDSQHKTVLLTSTDFFGFIANLVTIYFVYIRRVHITVINEIPGLKNIYILNSLFTQLNFLLVKTVY